MPAEVEQELSQTYTNGALICDEEELATTLCKVVGSCSNLYLLLDGMDECEKGTKKFLLKTLERLTSLRNATVRALVTCRDEDQMLRSLDRYPQIHLSAKASASDIESFVRCAVRARIQSRELVVSDPVLETQIVTELVAKSAGM